MIRVHKSAVAPEILRTKGLVETEELKKAYDAGERDFGKKFKDSIYAHKTVKDQLLEDQNHKCCFCEEIAIESSDVEHFRPKGKVSEAPGHPGYYWLVYDWENLLSCCSTCNSRTKNFWFPLVDPSKRVESHQGDIAQEEPLFLYPVQDEPMQHIKFDKFTMEGITDKGKRTVQEKGGLYLNRRELISKRRELWTRINKKVEFVLAVRTTQRTVPEAIQQLALCYEQEVREDCDPTKPFSAMVAIEVGCLFALTQSSNP